MAAVKCQYWHLSTALNNENQIINLLPTERFFPK